jgi:hypothetical protein
VMFDEKIEVKILERLPPLTVFWNRIHTSVAGIGAIVGSLTPIKIFIYNLFTQRKEKNTMQIRVSKRGGKRRTCLIGCKKK